MPGPILYSTNAFLKLHLQERFYGDVHYVWTSEVFDATKVGAYTTGGSLVAPSSDPAAIYRELRRATEAADRHCDKIKAQRASFQRLATKYADDRKITPEAKEEIFHWAKNATFKDWRPLVYVIPRAAVESRLELVKPELRASMGPEYVIKDLKRSEFDVIEL
jgi:hypothetical protein